MKLIFKNPTIKIDYEFSRKTTGLSVEECSRIWTRHKLTEERSVLQIPMGYFTSLCDMTDEYAETQKDISIDLTYETVKNIPKVLGYQYYAYTLSGSYTKDEAIKLLKKTLASYLMLLCMNEHMCFPSVSRLDNFEGILKSATDANATPLESWMGFTIKVGSLKEIDMLPEVDNAVRVTAKDLLRMRFSHVVDVYKSMCGVDLKEKGLEDFEAVSEKTSN